MIPAAIVARELECRLVETICVAAYDEEQRGDPVLLKPAPAAGDGTGSVIVDDLVDRGDTARLVRRLLPRRLFRLPLCQARRAGRRRHVRRRESPQETWVLFPWDTAPSFVPPIVRQPGWNVNSVGSAPVML